MSEVNLNANEVQAAASTWLDVHGRCDSRGDYWLRIVGIIVGYIVTAFIMGGLTAWAAFNLGYLVAAFFGLCTGAVYLVLVAMIAVLVVQRLRTLGAHWAFVFLLLLPPVNFLMVIALGIITPRKQ